VIEPSTAADPVILLTGGNGQVGYELARQLTALGRVVAPSRSELDLLDAPSIRDLIRSVRPAIVVNAAAHTMVDGAEAEPDLCARINADAPATMAAECHRLDALMIHLSTDYVFDGLKPWPYVETDATAPLGVYGRTKLAGEEAVTSAGTAHLTFRTAWVYSARGRNFVLTMLRLAREREELSVVGDQRGAPTSASAVALGVTRVLRQLLAASDFRKESRAASGVYHMTAAGATTWFDFARTILSDDPHATEQRCRVIRPVQSADYPTAARRPANSVLDNSKLVDRFGVRLAPWTEQWRMFAQQLRVRRPQ
jgi:dTDP-4-dehydrorhamnose reductase